MEKIEIKVKDIFVYLLFLLFASAFWFYGKTQLQSEINSVKAFKDLYFNMSILTFVPLLLSEIYLGRFENRKVLTWFIYASLAFFLINDTIYNMVNARPALLVFCYVGMVYVVKPFMEFSGDVLFSFFRTEGQIHLGLGKLSNDSSSINERLNLSSKDKENVAIHEVGHALVHAALGQLPNEFCIVIRAEKIKEGEYRLGYVRSIKSQHQSDRKEMTEWLMLMYLAGVEAEKFILGESETSLGAASDFLYYQDYAKKYLTTQNNGYFILDPKSDEDFKHNEAKFDSLKARQEQQLSLFFELNKDTLIQMKEHLLKHERITREESIEFLRTVDIPSDFPKPLGNFNEFSSEWTANEAFGIED